MTTLLSPPTPDQSFFDNLNSGFHGMLNETPQPDDMVTAGSRNDESLDMISMQIGNYQQEAMK